MVLPIRKKKEKYKEYKNKIGMDDEEFRRLVKFFEILIEIDKRERITETAKQIYGPKENKKTGRKGNAGL